MSEHVDNILSGKVERKHYQKEVEIWANDCIASYNIIADKNYPYQFGYKDLAHAIDRYNLDMNVLEQRNRELKQRNKDLKQALERSNYLLKGYKAQMHSFKLSEVIDEHIVTNEQLLKGKSDG